MVTNGDIIRSMNNEELARLIYGFVVTSKNSTTFFTGTEYNENIEDTKGYKVLLETFNEEADYE